MKDGDKIKAVYEIISDTNEMKARLQDYNFDKLLDCLEKHVGGAKQVGVISGQLEYAMRTMSLDREGNVVATPFCEKLEACVLRQRALGSTVDGAAYTKQFWEIWAAQLQDAEAKFKEAPAKRDGFMICFDNLVHFVEKFLDCLFPDSADDFRRIINLPKEKAKAFEAMSKLVSSKIQMVVEKLNAVDCAPVAEETTVVLKEQILLARYSKAFAYHFGKDIIALKRAVKTQETKSLCPACRAHIPQGQNCPQGHGYGYGHGNMPGQNVRRCPAPHCQRQLTGGYVNNTSCPWCATNCPIETGKVWTPTADAALSPMDPDHWGHLEWMFAEKVETLFDAETVFPYMGSGTKGAKLGGA